MHPANERVVSDGLAEELQALGFAIRQLKGGRVEFRRARRSGGADAVVQATAHRIRIWVLTTRNSPPIDVKKADGEKTELFVLRAAELLRGTLLPGQPSSPAPAVPVEPASRAVVAISTGPELVFRGYGAPVMGYGGEVLFLLGPLGLGPYVMGSLTRAPWNPAPKDFSVRDLSIGAIFSFRFLRPSPHWMGMGVAKTGLRWMSLRGESGPQKERFAHAHTLISVEAGLRFSFAFAQRFQLGTTWTGGVGFFTSRPDASRPTHPPQRRALSDWEPRPTGLGSLSVTGSVKF